MHLANFSAFQTDSEKCTAKACLWCCQCIWKRHFKRSFNDVL